MPDVVLVQMPFAPVDHPSIALGVLKGALAGTEISCRVLYPNLDFCQEIGLDTYWGLAGTSGGSLLAEWTFSAAAFPEHEVEAEAFLQLPSADLSPRTRHWLVGRFPNTAPVDRMIEIRAAARPFVDRVADHVLALGPRVVGCTSTFQQHCPAIALLRRIRELAPAVVTVLGGANCESVMGLATLRLCPWIDVVVSGEADLLFEDLCRRLLAHGRALQEVVLPFGALSQADLEQGRLEVDGDPGAVPRAAVQEMDRVAIPDYQEYFETLSGLPLEAFITPGLLIETSRGCWWGAKSHCTFCGLNGGQMTFRSKSAERVLEELRVLSEAYGINRFAAVDNILDTRFFKTVLPELAALPTRPSLFFEIKANLKRGQMELLSKAGVTWIQPGIENLHAKALELLRKGNSPSINVQCLKWALEFGIRAEWPFLYGMPGEEDAWYAELAEWLPALYHLEPPAGFTRIEYHRFSPYQMQPQEFGLDLAPQRGYRFVYPVSERHAADLAYYFEDSKHRVPRLATAISSEEPSLAETPGLAACLKRIGEWRSSWLQAFKRGEEPPRLLRQEEEGLVTLIDSRPCASQSERRLSRVETAVLDAVDHGGTKDSLTRRARAALNTDLDDAEVDAALAELIGARAVLDLDGTYLGLAVRAVAERVTLFPGGHPHLERFTDHWVRGRLGDLPLPAGLVSSYFPPQRDTGRSSSATPAGDGRR